MYKKCNYNLQKLKKPAINSVFRWNVKYYCTATVEDFCGKTTIFVSCNYL